MGWVVGGCNVTATEHYLLTHSTATSYMQKLWSVQAVLNQYGINYVEIFWLLMIIEKIGGEMEPLKRQRSLIYAHLCQKGEK